MGREDDKEAGRRDRVADIGQGITWPSGDVRDRPDAYHAPLFFVASREDLWHLMTDLRREDRDYPIVVLTPGDGAGEGFSPSAIRALDPNVPIYLLGNTRLSQWLTNTLGQQFAVEGGDARIFWAGFGEDSHAADHPLVPVNSASDPRDPATRLVSTFEVRHFQHGRVSCAGGIECHGGGPPWWQSSGCH